MAKKIKHTFTLIFKHEANGYTVEANGPNGINVTPQPFSWKSEYEHELTAKTLSTNTNISSNAIMELGKALYAAVFTPLIATAYGRAQASIKGDQGMRIQLQIEVPELILLPWEAMHDGTNFIATRSDYPLVRVLPLPKDISVRQRLQVRGALRILYVEAWPKDLVFPRGGEQDPVEQLRTSLSDLISKRQVSLDELRHATLDTLRDALLEDYHIVYFAGHGSVNKGIYLEDEDGNKQPILPEVLAQMLDGKATRLVFLNACHTDDPLSAKGDLLSSFARTLAVKAGLPAVIAMQGRISDRQATTLESHFFKSLAVSYSVEQALAEARKAMIHNQEIGRDVISPVMYLMAKDGKLFRRAFNWAVISFTIALIAILALIVQASLFQPEIEEIASAQQTAQAEAVARVAADNVAKSRQLVAQAQQVMDQAPPQISKAVLLLIESMYRYSESEASNKLLDILELLPAKETEVVFDGDALDASFSPDGQWVVAGGGNGTILVWEVETGHEIARMTYPMKNGIRGNVGAVAFSPDGQRVVSAGGDGTVRVWEVRSGHEIAQMANSSNVFAVAFSPDGKWVVSAGGDGTVLVWEAETGNEVSRMIHSNPVWNASFSPDGQRVVSASCDVTGGRARCLSSSVRVWDANTGREITQMAYESSQDHAINDIAFSPDGQWVVAGGGGGTILVWETETGREVSRMMHSDYVESVAFSPDGQRIVSGGGDGVRIWETVTGQEIFQAEHKDWGYVVAFSPNGQWIAAGSHDGFMRVWEAATGREVSQVMFEDWVRAIAFSPDGKWVVSASADGTARAWAIKERNTPGRMMYKQSDEAVEGFGEIVAFSPDGRWVASAKCDAYTQNMMGCSKGTVLVWEAETGSETARVVHNGTVTDMVFSTDGQWLATAGCEERLYNDFCNKSSIQVIEIESMAEVTQMEPGSSVYDLTFSPDGQWLASTGCDEIGDLMICLSNSARVWNARTGQEIVQMTPESDSIGVLTSIAFSPDGNWMVSGSTDYTARVWEVTTGREVSQMAHDDGIRAVAFSPDGQRVISGGSGGTARVWEAATGREVSRMVHEDEIHAVAFSPDGQWVISGSSDGTARVWEAETGREVSRMMHSDVVNTVAFSSDGKWVGSGSSDGTARVWEVETGREMSRMVHNSNVMAVAFSPDLRWFYSGNISGLVWGQQWRAEDLIDMACSRITHNFSYVEWERYFGDEPYRLTCPLLPTP